MCPQIKLRFGKYKGTMIKDVPDGYLRWCVDKNVLKGKAMIYAKQRLGYPKDKWEVTVEDSVDGDGKYVVEAYDRESAIRMCRERYKIQHTQSFCGTSYKTTKL